MHAGIPPTPQQQPQKLESSCNSSSHSALHPAVKLKYSFLSNCLQVSNIYRLMSLLHCLSAKINTFSSFSFPFKVNSLIQIIFLVALKFSAFVLHSRIQITRLKYSSRQENKHRKQQQKHQFSHSQFPLLYHQVASLYLSNTIPA